MDPKIYLIQSFMQLYLQKSPFALYSGIVMTKLFIRQLSTVKRSFVINLIKHTKGIGICVVNGTKRQGEAVCRLSGSQKVSVKKRLQRNLP